jgi:cytochrome P450
MTSDIGISAPDHYDAEYAKNPYPKLQELRQRCPVARSDLHGGYWIATKYDDIRELTQNTTTFSSRCTTVPKDIGIGDFCIPPVQYDPPDHTKIKRLLATGFVPARVAKYETPIRDFVNSLLDDLTTRSSFDASHDFARLVPTAVVSQLLGRPDMIDQFCDWVGRILEQAASNIEDSQVAGLEVLSFLAELVEERQQSPSDDIVSVLLHEAEIEGEKLEQADVVYTALLLILAGIDTAHHTIASGIHYLATHPDQQERLRQHPELINSAREEFLRAFAPVSPARVVTQDVVFGGQQMHKGDMVVVSFPSANRDEDQFPDADEIRLDRTPNRHLAFGSGAHRCLGVNVARMEINIALEEFMRRMRPFRLADDAEVVWVRGQVRGPKHLPITIAD